MPLSRDQVDHIARLARLSLTEQEVAQFTHELTAIVGYIDQLQEINTEGVILSAPPGNAGSSLRPDLVRPSLTEEQALANAPEAEDGFFRVPKVIG